MMKCPRCRALCADADLAPEAVTYERASPKVIVETDERDVWLDARDAEALQLDGKRAWVRSERTERLCRVCCDDLRRREK